MAAAHRIRSGISSSDEPSSRPTTKAGTAYSNAISYANTIAYILNHSEAKVLVVDRQLHVEVKKALN